MPASAPGLEIRGIQRELDLPKCKEFGTPEAIAASRRLMRSFVSGKVEKEGEY